MTTASTQPPAPAPATVIVAGSLNVDLIWQVPVLPGPGETVIANSRREEFGGKGANQAVAAKRQGATVIFAGATGTDAMGAGYRRHLEAEGIGTAHITEVQNASTGCAHVYLDAAGENMIVVEPGANLLLGRQTALDALRAAAGSGAMFLTQFECPLEVVTAALELAQELGIRSVLNPSPVNDAFRWGSVAIDTVIVNEHECLRWFGHSPAQLWEQSTAARAALLGQLRIRNLIVTRGKDATFHFDAQGRLAVPCMKVTPVDTVGAGDTFAGALTVQIARGADWPEAIRHANAAAALATQSMGAQTGMPTQQQVADALGALGG